MSAEIINLRQARKRKAREEKERNAGRARVVHGRSGTEKSAAKKLGDKLRTFLDAHRRREPRDSED